MFHKYHGKDTSKTMQGNRQDGYRGVPNIWSFRISHPNSDIFGKNCRITLVFGFWFVIILAADKTGEFKNWRTWYKTGQLEVLTVHDLLAHPATAGEIAQQG